MFRPSGLRNSITFTASSLRSRPLSTKTQCSLSPIALLTSTAATVESTPPLMPHTTVESPATRLISSIWCWMKLFGDQSGVMPAMSIKKFESSCLP